MTGSEFFSLLDCKELSFGVEISANAAATAARVEFVLPVPACQGQTAGTFTWQELKIKALDSLAMAGAPLDQVLLEGDKSSVRRALSETKQPKQG